MVALLGLLACEPTLPPPQLPQLAAAPPRLAPMAVRALVLPAGETMIWDVHADGLTIGRAELAIGDTEVRSKFKTGQLASMIATAKHDATTALDRRALRPRGMDELLQLDTEVTRVHADLDGASVSVGKAHTTIPGHQVGQTLHTALGWVRAWAAPGAEPGFLFVIHMGELYRLDIGRPRPSEVAGTRALEIECRAGVYRSKDDPIAMKLWLSADARRVPLRIEVTVGTLRLTAELIEHATR
ncbi:MAG: DUF3108 domain-containing protein [Deltaproteobacteria bacterium]|nr:DUF3108 domain-containing protein [Deltaproteobacteria bacterium]